MDTHLSKVRKAVAAGILLLAGASLIQTVRLIYKHRKTVSTVYKKTYAKAQEKTTRAADDIGEHIAILMPTAKKLAEQLSSEWHSKAEIEKALKQKPTELHGLGVAFVPYGYSDREELYAPYYEELDGKNTLIDISEEYNYTTPDILWFHTPLKQGPQFLEPYYGPASKTIIAEYSVPFYDPRDSDPDKKPIGIVFANQSVDNLAHIITSRYSGSTGYWFLLSGNGTFLAHPDKRLTATPTTIFDLAKRRNDSSLEQAGKDAVEGKPVFVHYTNEITNAPSMLICNPLPNIGWSICQVFDTNELPFEKDMLRRSWMHIIFALLLCILFTLLFFFIILPYATATLWTLSLLTSLALATGIGSLWTITAWYPHYMEYGTRIKDQKSLHQFWQQVTSGATLSGDKSTDTTDTQRHNTGTHIPTGIFINDLQFKDPSQVSFVGYIWQRYNAEQHADLTRGFVLPQALRTSTREIYRARDGGDDLITWEVSADVSQRAPYFMYPFDIKDVELELWHPDFKDGIFMDPDLDAYKILNPRSLPGVSHDARLEGWDLTSSLFSYRFSYPRTNFGMYTRSAFGIRKQAETEGKPGLTFVIRAERRLVETLFADLLPLTVIALLLFATLMAIETIGIGTLGICASLFFGTVYAQSRFRTRVPAYELTYFENFYFVLYIVLLAVVLVALFRQLGFKGQIAGNPIELVLKLLYWPLIFGTLVLITVRYLY